MDERFSRTASDHSERGSDGVHRPMREIGNRTVGLDGQLVETQTPEDIALEAEERRLARIAEMVRIAEDNGIDVAAILAKHNHPGAGEGRRLDRAA